MHWMGWGGDGVVGAGASEEGGVWTRALFGEGRAGEVHLGGQVEVGEHVLADRGVEGIADAVKRGMDVVVISGGLGLELCRARVFRAVQR